MNTIEYSINYQRYVNELNFNYKLFWASVLLYSISGGLGDTFIESLYKIEQLFQMIALLGIFYSTYHVVQFRSPNKVISILLVVYFLWVIFITFYGYEYTYERTKSVIFGGVFKYLFPLLLFFPRNLFFYKRLFSVIFILSIAHIVYNLIFFEEVTTHYETNVNEKFIFEAFTRNFAVPMGFLLFTYIYHSKTKNLTVLLSVLLMVGVSAYRARRSILALGVVYLLIFLLILYLYSNRKVLMAMLFGVLLLVASVYAGEIYQKLRFSFFEKIEERSTENTREYVEVAFYRDFELQDWIIGRGINGTYFCPNIDVNDTTGYRRMIETDYLNMILKGGSILLVLILLISLPAAFKALFRSKNLLSKAAGIWIILWILSLYPMNVFIFSVNYMIFWIAVGIGYSRDIRYLSDETIKEAFR